jgi:hypothetical protein
MAAAGSFSGAAYKRLPPARSALTAFPLVLGVPAR